MKPRILVLGAGGFIGRRVVNALVDTDWATPVSAHHRAASSAPTTEQMVINAVDESQLRQALRGIDGVVNCVAGNRSVMVDGARALFLAANAQSRPPRIVQLSTMSVYGSATGVTDEGAELRGDLGSYSCAKIEAERLARSCASVVTLRPSCVYGPESPQWSERIAHWLMAHRIGDLGSAGDGFANLIYIDDLVAAIMSSLRTPGIEGQAFNLSNRNPPTWNEYFLRYAIALGAVPVSRISRRRLSFETKVLAPPLKVAEIVMRKAGISRSGLPAPIPSSLLGLWQREILVDGRKAESLMQLKLTPLDHALSATADWFKGITKPLSQPLLN